MWRRFDLVVWTAMFEEVLNPSPGWLAAGLGGSGRFWCGWCLGNSWYDTCGG